MVGREQTSCLSQLLHTAGVHYQAYSLTLFPGLSSHTASDKSLGGNEAIATPCGGQRIDKLPFPATVHIVRGYQPVFFAPTQGWLEDSNVAVHVYVSVAWSSSP